MIATTLEQSRKLMELGVDVNTADMCYKMFSVNDSEWQYELIPIPPTTEDIGAWSLSALLDLLPHAITTDEGDEYTLEMCKEYDLSYVILYVDAIEMHQIVEFDNQELIDAAFDAVVWLKENNYD